MKDPLCLDPNYSTTRMLFKIVGDECLDEQGRIMEKHKWNITNPEFNIQNSKLIGNPEDKFETVLFLPEGEGRKGEGGLRTRGYFKKSFEDKPLISIITVVLNGAKYLEETIQSVINQTYDNVEYIIIDGGSTDGTLDIIKKYDDRIDYWVSERDKGISEAFNKGITLSLGLKLLMLNAGDIFSFYDILQKNINLISQNTDVVFFSVKVDKDRMIPSQTSKVNIKNILDNLEVPHQGAFVSLHTYKKHGLYSINFKIRMDYEFFSRLVNNQCSFIFKDIIIVDYSVGGVSMMLKNRFTFIAESVIADYFYGRNNRNSIKIKIKKFISFAYLIFNGKL